MSHDAPTEFDFAIVGAGVSGLCLARLLLKSSLEHKTVLVIDGARDDDQLRTLSFWSDEPSVFEELVEKSWTSLELRDDEGSRRRELRALRYRTLFWADLQRAVLAEVRAAKGSRVVDGRAGDVTSDAEGARIEVGDRSFRARWVFDSRFRLAELEVDTRRYHLLKQHFTGWLVKAPRDAFEPDVATLFDFRTGLAAGRSFFYVLPLAAREALVELVTLDAVDAGPVIERYIAERLGLERVEIVAKEHGVSPMTEQPFARVIAPRVRAIGISAGRLKASTGYALTRIEDDARAIVRSLETLGHPDARPPDRALYRFLDAVLLEVWSAWPERIPGIFQALFARNPADRVLAFLDERARFWSIVALVWTLPFWPFVRGFARWLWRRVFGRGAAGGEPGD